jgi:FkbM family methyltransferase
MESCWSDHFTYELCCLGDVGSAELPHYFVGPAYDLNVANAVRQVGTFDLGQSYAMQTLCKTGDVVLDIGANIGGFTVPLAERVGPTGEVHAFEPFRKVFQHLNANVALNGLGNVFTYNTALGQEDKALEVFTPDLNTFNFPSAMKVEEQYLGRDAEAQNVRYEKRQERISVRRLDGVDFHGKRVSFVKIDVEFMELDVVLGGREFFRQHRPVIWAENEPFFDDPPNRTFVDTMANELDYVCQVVARLELLCTPRGADSLPPGFERVMRHLSGRAKDISLWRALSEVQPTEANE